MQKVIAESGQAQDIGVFLLFGAANTLGFLHVSETLGHIGIPSKFSIIFSPLDFVFFQQIFRKKVKIQR